MPLKFDRRWQMQPQADRLGSVNPGSQTFNPTWIILVKSLRGAGPDCSLCRDRSAACTSQKHYVFSRTHVIVSLILALTLLSLTFNQALLASSPGPNSVALEIPESSVLVTWTILHKEEGRTAAPTARAAKPRGPWSPRRGRERSCPDSAPV